MYLIDTDFIAQARLGIPQAVGWMRKVNPLAVFISALSFGEMTGAVSLMRSSDPHAARQLTDWLRALRHDHADRILPVSTAIAAEWGKLLALGPRRDRDGLIAATAIVHDLILVTRHDTTYEDTGVSLINPWEDYV